MEKRESTLLASILAAVALALSIVTVGMQQPNICWRCMESMPLDFELTHERHDGSVATYRRWRCPACRRTNEITKDSLW